MTDCNTEWWTPSRPSQTTECSRDCVHSQVVYLWRELATSSRYTSDEDHPLLSLRECVQDPSRANPDVHRGPECSKWGDSWLLLQFAVRVANQFEHLGAANLLRSSEKSRRPQNMCPQDFCPQIWVSNLHPRKWGQMWGSCGNSVENPQSILLSPPSLEGSRNPKFVDQTCLWTSQCRLDLKSSSIYRLHGSELRSGPVSKRCVWNSCNVGSTILDNLLGVSPMCHIPVEWRQSTRSLYDLHVCICRKWFEETLLAFTAPSARTQLHKKGSLGGCLILAFYDSWLP